MEYVTEELITADKEQMQEFYITHREEVDRLEQRIREYDAERENVERVS
jgi:cob(I)alamin adenosyltransferase